MPTAAQRPPTRPTARSSRGRTSLEPAVATGTYPWTDVCRWTQPLEQHAGFPNQVPAMRRTRQRKATPAPVIGCEHLDSAVDADQPEQLSPGCQECMEAGESR